MFPIFWGEKKKGSKNLRSIPFAHPLDRPGMHTSRAEAPHRWEGHNHEGCGGEGSTLSEDKRWPGSNSTPACSTHVSGGSPSAVAHPLGPKGNFKDKMCWCLLLSWIIKYWISFLGLPYQITIIKQLKNNRNVSSHSYEGQKSQIKVSGLNSSSSFSWLLLVLGLWAHHSSLCFCLHSASSPVCRLPFSSKDSTQHDLTLRVFNLITSAKTLSLSSQVLGGRIFWEITLWPTIPTYT